ncbi:MAG: PAS domain S-box protein [Chloroflexi bacterium]|nr:PAS domain S-box protein [Chloroflexota bacterium]
MRQCWKFLTGPVPAVRQQEERRQAELLTALLLFIALAGMVIWLLPFLTHGGAPWTSPWFAVGFLNMAVLTVCFVLNRRGFYRLSAVLVILYGFGTIMVMSVLDGGDSALRTLHYFIAVTVFSSLIFSPRVGAVLYIIQIAGMVLLALLSPPSFAREIIAGPLAFNILLGVPILLVVHFYRQREIQRQVQLTESETRYRSLVENLRDVVYTHQPDGTITGLNSVVEQLVGWPRQAILGRSVMDFIHPDDQPLAVSLFRHMRKGESPPPFELRLLTQSGAYVWTELKVSPVMEDGRMVYVSGVARDISERKQIESILREANQMIQVVVNHSPLPIVALDLDGVVTLWNAAAERTFGWKEREVLGRPYPIVPEEKQAEYQEFLHEMIEHGRVLIGRETYRKRRDGSLVDVGISGGPLRDAQGTISGAVVLFEDITERKRAEAALRESEERYRIISELISDYAYSLRVEPDGSTVMDWITDSYRHITGFSWEDANAIGLHNLYHPEDADRALQDIRQVAEGQANAGEYRLLTRSGAYIWVLLHRLPVWDAEQKRVVRIYGVAQNITAHKEAEAQKLRLALQRERLKLLGQFVRAISHDFRTTLANIETSRYLIERALNDETRQAMQPRLHRIHECVERLSGQLDNLYTVSAVTDPNTVPYDLNRLIEGLMHDLAARAQEKELNFVFKAHPYLPLIAVNATELARAIRHLIMNAITYTPPGGAVTVGTRLVEDNIEIEVRDTGTGISPEHQPHIFDLFYRADASRTIDSGGIGLGLSIVKMVVEAHGGRIDLESTLGSGTVFVIGLPLAPLETASPPTT